MLCVFGELCRAEGGNVAVKSYTTPQGEQVSRPACEAGTEEPLVLSRSEFVGLFALVGRQRKLLHHVVVFWSPLPSLSPESHCRYEVGCCRCVLGAAPSNWSS